MKKKMTLAELETEARLVEERKVAESEAQARAEAKEQEEILEDLKADVADWLAEVTWLDPSDVLPCLTVSLYSWDNMARCQLSLACHVPIMWEMAVREDGLEMQGRNPYTVRDLHHATLAEALLRSSDEWVAQQKRVKQEASEAASWEARKQEQAAQGQHYLDLITSYPILGPILEMLAVFVGQQDEYESAVGCAYENLMKEVSSEIYRANR